MSLSTYLALDGNCREAFEFYRSIFGTEFQVFTTYGEGSHDMQVSEADKDKVMHVSLPIGSSVLMGSDNVDCHGHDSPPLVIGNNLALMYLVVYGMTFEVR